MRLILASSSQGRKKILSFLKIPFTVIPSTVDEEKIFGKTPLETLKLRAKAKAGDVTQKLHFPPLPYPLVPSSYLTACRRHSLWRRTAVALAKEVFILSADSGAILDNQLIGKPKDYDDAVRILTMLSGKTHEFITAIYATKISKLPSITLRTGKNQIFPPQRDPASGGTNLNLKSKNFKEKKATPKGSILETDLMAKISDLPKKYYYAQDFHKQKRLGVLEKFDPEGLRGLRTSKKFFSEGLRTTIWQDYERSFVTFRELTPEDINLYLSLTDYTKYAGGYVLVSAQNFIVKIEGSISNVVGLPLEKVIPILKENKLLPYRSYALSCHCEATK